MIYIDGHCDTLTEIYRHKENLFQNKLHIDLNRIINNNLKGVQCFAIFPGEGSTAGTFENTMSYVDFYYSQVQKYDKFISHANTYAEIINNVHADVFTGILAIEGGEALEGELNNLYEFHEKGVRILTLTWNHENELGCGVLGGDEKGLTRFGKQIVKEINTLKMIIDVSHLSEKGFWDVYRLCRGPFAATHSNAKSICPSVRNLSDDQIRAVRDKQGIIGINLYSGFLNIKEPAGISDIVKHALHIADTGGEDILTLGCDFDGINNMPEGIAGIESLPELHEVFAKELGKELTKKIFYNNYLNFFKKTL